MKRIFRNPLMKAIPYALGFWLLAFIIESCVSRADDLSANATNSKPAVMRTPVDGIVVQPSEISEELEVVGTLVANQRVDIVSELTRKIVRVNVKEGSKVKEGALLFQLDDADLQAQLERLRQEEKLALLNEERLKDLIANEAIAQQDYDQASTNLKVIQAQIRELQVTISKTRITAPFNGQVGIINVHPGSIVSVNTILTDIEDNSVIKVDFSVPEKYTNTIYPGSVHTFKIASNDKEYQTKVIARAASLKENTRTLLVRSETANPNGNLLPGQSARLTLALSTSDSALSVASNALIPSSKGYSVYVSRNNAVVPVPVVIGQRSESAVVITSGLQKGDTVITSNLLRLVPGAPIQFVTLQ
ncbi:efflux RND transporter periplasmic adaptor subunit [Chryseolinea sp. H1M3-3]|uniref:efflux RND transporter periplasmic adaptor subunit n=1 Tax=Chryseolinea sp. H1M3-3 TaxID=3034144 RepID=UPI0023ED5F5C|nr:efflux RND transporter periplasmic adaptor subunit [Chryseolinea sp. H1M3-3]